MAMSSGSSQGREQHVLELELARNGSAPLMARAAIARFCRDVRSSPKTIATVTLLVSEVVTNAVIHPVLNPPGNIGLSARLSRGAINVEVTDGGSGFTPTFRTPAPLGGGYGLFLVEQEAARWGVKGAPQTTVWFEVPNSS